MMKILILDILKPLTHSSPTCSLSQLFTGWSEMKDSGTWVSYSPSSISCIPRGQGVLVCQREELRCGL